MSQTAPVHEGGSATQAVEQAATDQIALTHAGATQAQPANTVISVRINSPGDDAPIRQTNSVVVAGSANNRSATAQAASLPKSPSAAGRRRPAAEQAAATDQIALTHAGATQAQPANTVISVRINSPGDDAPIRQT
ncbi:MAG: hypothetical protein M3322_04045, partial [Actinomycetota bacterium]|nr:hypothetical protein [Actinomycetota bacterium]